MNKIIVNGKLITNPKVVKNNKKNDIVRYTLAAERHGNVGSDLIPCVSEDRKTIDYVCNNLHVGSSVELYGHLHSEEVESSNGKSHFTLEIIIDEVFAPETEETEEEENVKTDKNDINTSADDYTDTRNQNTPKKAKNRKKNNQQPPVAQTGTANSHTEPIPQVQNNMHYTQQMPNMQYMNQMAPQNRDNVMDEYDMQSMPTDEYAFYPEQSNTGYRPPMSNAQNTQNMRNMRNMQNQRNAQYQQTPQRQRKQKIRVQPQPVKNTQELPNMSNVSDIPNMNNTQNIPPMQEEEKFPWEL